MEPTSRIAEARRRAAAVLAYGSHPGTASNASTGSDGVSTSGGESSDGDSFGFGSGSIGPSDGTVPQVQSHVS